MVWEDSCKQTLLASTLKSCRWGAISDSTVVYQGVACYFKNNGIISGPSTSSPDNLSNLAPSRKQPYTLCHTHHELFNQHQ